MSLGRRHSLVTTLVAAEAAVHGLVARGLSGRVIVVDGPGA